MPKPEEMNLEPVPAAAKREITEDGTGARKVDDDLTRAATWERVFRYDPERKWAFYRKMVLRHGLEKGTRVYWWFSGKTERAPREWQEALRQEAPAA
jgi:hypothetical protein